MTQRDVFVVGAARTAIGTYGGTLKDKPVAELATAPMTDPAAVHDEARRGP